MTYSLNETHDPKARSWVASANLPETDFPIQNLPLGVFHQDRDCGRIGVAIGDQILDLKSASEASILRDVDEITCEALQEETLNTLTAIGAERWSALRRNIFHVLREGSELKDEAGRFLLPMNSVRMLVPATIGDYTDFYASIYHATNVGSMFRPDNPLLPNYKWVPIGYHGRASSIVVSGTPVRRPSGQTKGDGADRPIYGLSKRLDYELEVGVFMGTGNELGVPISIDAAPQHAFGLCLVNDWSARDLQTWEYQPLGPFLAKNFATTISPWIVTFEALAPYRVPAFRRATGDPEPLPHLSSREDEKNGGLEITLEVFIRSQKMQEQGIPGVRVSSGNFRDMYWTIAQLIAHHTSNGCDLRPGDLLASGTVSGKTKGERGCLLELTWKGTEPIQLPTGEERRFLENGDEVQMRAYCHREGTARIGFGTCEGTIIG